jgi:hypothetical protein
MTQKKFGHYPSKMPDRHEILRLAVAASALGMTIGINPGDTLAVPKSPDSGLELAGPVTGQPLHTVQGQTAVPKLQPVDPAYIPGAAFPKVEQPGAAFPKVEQPDAAFPKVEQPGATFKKW